MSRPRYLFLMESAFATDRRLWWDGRAVLV